MPSDFVTPDGGHGIPPSDRVVMRCTTCGKEKPNDIAWARPAMCCGAMSWTSSVTFTETPEGIVTHGDVRYGLEVPE